MKQLLTPFYILSATFVGIADTLYLSYFHYMNLIPSCAIGGCEIVLTSPYSSPFGVPFAYIGLFYYASMLGLALLLAYDPYSKGLRLGMLLYTGLGLLLSIGFELFQYFVIHALCMYCGISAATTLVLFCLALWHWRTSKQAYA
ncbi:MAG TPA: vitamin K epoxide reductase family protein [Candidatus Paceibacterota bacterium]|nr:vitamin K epoxide reductase family protein [Candidatus Paceibacterota bacterium]